MSILGHPTAELAAAGGIWTAREIAQQPAVWRKIAETMEREAAALQSFLEPLLTRPNLRIVLTGAGTSAFVGECLAAELKGRTQVRVEPLATTDMVGSPASWLEPATPTLLVSFARSGNSPESVAALMLAENGVPDCHHLIFTCNAEGQLFRQQQLLRSAYAVLLPAETNDAGFAMTSSFSGMMLAAALAFRLLPADAPNAMAEWASQLLELALPRIAKLAKLGFERVVYLGTAAFKGLARESALKLLELSDGKVVALAESPLGFRHGPKTVVNSRTLVVLFLSNDPYARRYELDVLRELRADAVAARVVVLCAESPDTPTADDIVLPEAVGASSLALCFPYVVAAQAFAFLQSLSLGLRPDTPNASGVVNRVVQGVSIYPWSAHS
jgi:tagatose-6-phosphate ketose/aldose isomerase